MKQCIYDNPRTMRRELWRDGAIVASWSLEHIIMCAANGQTRDPIEWRTGRLDGDREAMKVLP